MKSKDIYMYALGGIIVMSILVIIGLLIFYEMPAGNREPLLLILGTLVGSFSSVVNFFYGSSKGSADKTELIAGKKLDA